MEVKVIGPQPPCIRCKTALKRARQAAGKFVGVKVTSLETHTEEAKKYGNTEGGHTISQKEKVRENHKRIEALRAEIDELEIDEEANREKIRELVAEIEKELTPVKTKARETGYLMTPVVVVNDKVKLAGEIPEVEQIETWIKEEL